MKRRPRRGLPATVTALVVLAASAVVAVVAIQTIVGEEPWLDIRSVATALHDTRWGDTALVWAGGGLAVTGLLLLLAAVVPGRPTVLPLAGDGAGTDSGASRRSLRSTVLAAASSVDGVDRARVRMRRRRIRTAVRTNRTNPAGLDDAVGAAVDHRLDQIALVTRPTLAVRVHAPRSRP